MSLKSPSATSPSTASSSRKPPSCGAGDAAGLTPEALAENRGWMQEAGALDADDVLILCFQSYVVKTPHHTS